MSASTYHLLFGVGSLGVALLYLWYVDYREKKARLREITRLPTDYERKLHGPSTWDE